jgi:hypothetical protein
MTDANEEQPKIIVDSDWKEEAQREKEKLDEETRDAPPGGELPPPSLAELVQMIIVQASIGLGGYQDPQSGQRIPPNLPIAKHYIDLLELLSEKTRNNLDEEEKKIIEGTLHELRLAFVQIAGAGAGGGPAPEASPESGGSDA